MSSVNDIHDIKVLLAFTMPRIILFPISLAVDTTTIDFD